jgi:hypothetical protein
VFRELDPQQLPDTTTGGVGSILLDIVAGQLAQKERTGQAAEFQVEDIDLPEPPPAACLSAALETAAALGFVTPDGSRLTHMGRTAARFSRLGMEAARVVLAAFVWGASVRDALTLAAAFDTPVMSLMTREHVLKAKGAQLHAALRDALPVFLRNTAYVGGSDGKERGPTEEETFLYRTRLLVADGFVETLLVFDAFQAKLAASYRVAVDWCAAVGLSFGRMLDFAAKRETYVEDLLVAGLDPFFGEDKKLGAADPDTFVPRLAVLKQCLYDGLRLKLLRYDAGGNTYRSRHGLQVSVPASFSDQEMGKLRALGGVDASKPEFILTSNIIFATLKPDKKGVKPLLYKFTARICSVMDGFVAVDPKFMTHRETDERPSPDSKRPVDTREARPLATDSEHPATDDKRPATDDKRPATDSEHPATDSEHPATDGEHSATDSEHPATDSEHPATDGKRLATDSEHPATDGKRLATDSEHLATDGKRPAADGKRPAKRGGDTDELADDEKMDPSTAMTQLQAYIQICFGTLHDARPPIMHVSEETLKHLFNDRVRTSILRAFAPHDTRSVKL